MGEGKEGTEEGEKVEMGEEEEGKDLLPLQQHYYKQETETITSPPTPTTSRHPPHCSNATATLSAVCC